MIRFQGLSHLQHFHFHPAFGRLQSVRLVAIPITSMRGLVWVPLIVSSTQMTSRFPFQGFPQKVLNPLLSLDKDKLSISTDTIIYERGYRENTQSPSGKISSQKESISHATTGT